MQVNLQETKYFPWTIFVGEGPNLPRIIHLNYPWVCVHPEVEENENHH